MKKITRLLTTCLAALTLVGCNKGEEYIPNMLGRVFGDFDYNGVFLTEYAIKQIKVDEAKKLVDIRPNLKRNYKLRETTEEDIKTVLSKYASLVTTVKYYISGNDEQQVRSDIYQGTDFKYLLENNYYEPFGQMSVKYIFVDDDLLDEMEAANEEFINNKQHLVSPFNEPFTYHTSDEDKLIVQTHHFAELPASIGGGIGSTFRQDCELLFDEEGKITFWQSSLGLYTSTPTGTVKEGYVFEVGFEWISK